MTTTGFAQYTYYYVVNASSNTFRIEASVGGGALTLTGTGSANVNAPSYIQSFTSSPNTITLDVPCSANGSVTLTCSILDTSLATLKNWTVSR